MDREELKKILTNVKEGEVSVDDAVSQFVHGPIRHLGHARLDLHRQIRNGFAEVIYAEGKEISELVEIVQASLNDLSEVLITRLTKEQTDVLQEAIPSLQFFIHCGVAYHKATRVEDSRGKIAVITAGTSDIRVAEEASACAAFFELEVEKIYDVGVAGLSRLIEEMPVIEAQDVLIVVAGMEGALPGILSGLTPVPVIGVPTSVGYGASLGGLTAFLSMLVSCSPGLTVVNIDNGFGAALAAAKLIRHLGVQTSKIA